MKKLMHWRDWGITSRLMTIAVVPTLLMCLVVNLTLYFSGRDELASDIQERGRLIAAALTESSRYGVISGNIAYLERTLKGLLSVDRSIASIEVLDERRKPVVVAGGPTGIEGMSVFEMPIRAQSIDIDPFDSTAEPNVPAAAKPAVALGQTVGYVRVAMSPAPLLEAKRTHLYFSATIVLAAALLSMMAALWLAQTLRQPLRAVMTALREIRQGRYDVHLDPRPNGELGELQRAILDMTKNLSISRHEFEELVASRTRELQAAVDAAKEAHMEKQRLLAHGNELVEEERRRIAADIHDFLNAALISVRLWAESITAEAAKANPGEVERLAKRIFAVTDSLYASVRRIVKQLRPEVIDTLGLKGAVEEMVRTYDEAHPHCRFACQVDAAFPNLRGQLAMTAFRVIQEALSNVVKHAVATQATVSLGQNARTGQARITISDGGKGFDTRARISSGLGLIGMRERVSAAGGKIVIASRDGAGTSIEIELPVVEQAKVSST